MDLHQTCSQPCPWTSWRTQQMYSKIRALPGFCDALALPSTLGKDQHCELRSARRWDKLHTPVLWLFWVHSMINIPGSPQMARTEVFWCVDLFWSLRWNDFFFKGHFRWFKTSCLDFLFSFWVHLTCGDLTNWLLRNIGRLEAVVFQVQHLLYPGDVAYVGTPAPISAG